MPPIIQEILTATTQYLEKKGVESPRLDAELLLAKGLGLSRVLLYVQYDRPLQESELDLIRPLVQRRGSREPLAYILGEKEFYSLHFKVTPDVLIPRPETEELVEIGIKHCAGLPSARLLDLATGSGCILLSLLKNIPNSRGTGLDVSSAALEVARENTERLGVGDRAEWIEHDLRNPWPQELTGPFDLITANLPYVSAEEWKTLEPEVRDFEPRGALMPDTEESASGVEAFEWVLPQIPSRLAHNGLALFEIGMDQGEPLLSLVQKMVPTLSAEILLDLSKRPRILRLEHRSRAE